MHSLVDFLNHGILPFVGRSAESARIVQFWRSTFEAYRLRASLLLGEAGIGKSRLIEETIPTIVAGGGAVVYVRLYAESPTSLVPLVARALWQHDAGRSLLPKEPEETPGAVAAALRRVSRLRATLLVIEDIHLLGGDALREFSQLLAAICEETLSLLCVGRRVELEARPVLEPYLLEEAELTGLTAADYEELWRMVMGSEAESPVTQALHRATAGNPLALRSALRGAVKAGTVEQAPENNAWRIKGSLSSFSRSLKQNVDLLAEGMTAHLSDGERRAAQQLACLGEVFSHEAAETLIEDAPAIVKALASGGIIANAGTTATPLVGGASRFPLMAFTHTLLHHRLVKEAGIPSDRLIRVVAERLPIYSILPFHLLCNRGTDRSGDPDDERNAAETAIDIALEIDATPDWRLKDIPLSTAVVLIEDGRGRWEPSIRSDLEMKLLEAALRTSHREPYEVQRPMIEELLERTREPHNSLLAAIRVSALGTRIWNDPSTRIDVCREVDLLLERFPELLSHPFHASFLNNLASSLIVTGSYDDDGMRELEHRIDRALEAEGVEQRVREKIYLASAFTLLANPSSHEEFERQISRLQDLESYSENVRARGILIRADRMMNIGMFDRYIDDIEWALRYYRDLGLESYTKGATAFLIFARAAHAATLDAFEREAEESLAGLHQEEVTFWRRYVSINLITYALLRGEVDRACHAAARYPEGVDRLSPALQQLLGLVDGEFDHAAEPAESETQEDAAIESLARFLANPSGEEIDRATTSARSILKRSPLRIYDLLYTQAVIGFAGELDGTPSGERLLSSLGEALHDVVVRELEWLAEPGRELHAFMSSLLDRGSRYLTAKELESWRGRIASIVQSREQRATSARGSDGRIRISMLGAIAAHTPDSEPQRFQGARIRQLLGVMIANQMLAKPLSVIEFRQLTAGSEVIESESARNILKKTVHRLREMLGHDTILTDGETPRLNPELVRVDLLEAREQLRNTREALRHSSPMKAKSALVAAFEITRSEVPFPTLYDDFFEAAREEFETELRNNAIDVATELLRQGAAADAEEVLHRTLEVMPGDEDLAELLRDVLKRQGKHTEAARVKMRSAIDAMSDV
jgi:hypothetical protein